MERAISVARDRPSGQAPRGGARTPRRRGGRYRFRRRHTLHYYLVLLSLIGAFVVAVLDIVALQNGSVVWAEGAFAAVLIATLVVFVTFFCGVSMALTGRVPVHRLKYVAAHGAAGTVIPLLYTLNICFALDGVGNEPLQPGSAVCGVLCFLLLLGQFGMGKTVVYREPLRLVGRQ